VIKSCACVCVVCVLVGRVVGHVVGVRSLVLAIMIAAIGVEWDQGGQNSSQNHHAMSIGWSPPPEGENKESREAKIQSPLLSRVSKPVPRSRAALKLPWYPAPGSQLEKC